MHCIDFMCISKEFLFLCAQWVLELENFQYSRQGIKMEHWDDFSSNIYVGFINSDDIDVQLRAIQGREQNIVDLSTQLEDHYVENLRTK